MVRSLILFLDSVFIGRILFFFPRVLGMMKWTKELEEEEQTEERTTNTVRSFRKHFGKGDPMLHKAINKREEDQLDANF